MKNRKLKDSSAFAILILAAYSVMPAIGRIGSNRKNR